MSALKTVLSFLVVLFFHAIWRGYVLTILWEWFIMPTFKAPALSIPLAIGLIVIMMIFRSIDPDEDNKARDDTYWLKTWFYAFSSPAFLLLIGYIVKQFI